MRTTTVSDLKAHLSAWLERVRAGNEVLVTDRGRPVARLVPVSAREVGDERLAALSRAGLVRVGPGSLPADFWSRPRPAVAGRAALDAVLQERDER